MRFSTVSIKSILNKFSEEKRRRLMVNSTYKLKKSLIIRFSFYNFFVKMYNGLNASMYIAPKSQFPSFTASTPSKFLFHESFHHYISRSPACRHIQTDFFIWFFLSKSLYSRYISIFLQHFGIVQYDLHKLVFTTHLTETCALQI